MVNIFIYVIMCESICCNFCVIMIVYLKIKYDWVFWGKLRLRIDYFSLSGWLLYCKVLNSFIIFIIYYISIYFGM